MNTLQPAIDNAAIYEVHWTDWTDMKRYGPASRWLRHLVRQSLRDIDPASVESVLDVGCGEGTLTAHLAKLLPYAAVRGIDVARSGLRLAARDYGSLRVRFAEQPIEEERASYHLVSAFEVLEHVEDWKPFLAAMARCSRRYLLLSFPTGRMRPYEVHVGHHRNFAKGEVEAFLSTCGFVPVSLAYAGFPFYSPFYRDACNATNSGSNQLSTGSYGFAKKRLCDLLLLLFQLSSQRRWGDQFCGLFEKASA